MHSNLKILKKNTGGNIDSDSIPSNPGPTLDCTTDFPPLPQVGCSSDTTNVKETKFVSRLKNDTLLCCEKKKNTSVDGKIGGTQSEATSDNLGLSMLNEEFDRNASEKQMVQKFSTQPLRSAAGKRRKKKNRTIDPVVKTEVEDGLCEEAISNDADIGSVADVGSREEYPELSHAAEQSFHNSKQGYRTRGKQKYVSVAQFSGSTLQSVSWNRNNSSSTYGWVPSRSFSDILKATTMAPFSLKLKTSEAVPNEKPRETGSSKSKKLTPKDEKTKKNEVLYKTPQKGANTSKPKGAEDQTTKKSPSATPLNLSDFIVGSNHGRSGKVLKRKEISKNLGKKGNSATPSNILDSSAPLRKRGKEREVPKRKQLSALKKIILKEREWKKNNLLRLSEKSDDSSPEESPLQENCNSITPAISEVTKENPDGNKSQKEDPESLTDGKLPDESISAVTKENNHIEKRNIIAKQLFHGRKFREYCDQFLSQDIDSLISSLLSELVRFQDRLYQKDPVKSKAKKRLVCGLREVTKHLKLKKVRVLIITPDIEKINSEGGLDDMLTTILKLSGEYRVPCIFGLNRRKIGYILKKKVPVCCVGIFNYEGAEEIYKQLSEKADDAKAIYKKSYQNIYDFLKPELLDSITEPMSATDKQELWKKITEDTFMRFDSELQHIANNHEE